MKPCKACGRDYAGQDFGRYLDPNTGRCPECIWHIGICSLCGDPAHIGEMVHVGDGKYRPITKDDAAWIDDPKR